MKEQLIQGTTSEREVFRDCHRRYFNAEYVNGLKYIYQVVAMLLHNPMVKERFVKKYSEDKYVKSLEFVKRGLAMFSEIAIVDTKIEELKRLTDMKTMTSQNIKRTLVKYIHISARNMNLFEYDLWKLHDMLVSWTTLRNIPIPREIKYRTETNLPMISRHSMN